MKKHPSRKKTESSAVSSVKSNGTHDSPAQFGSRVEHCSADRGPSYDLLDAEKCNETDTEASSKWSNRGHWLLTVFECPFCNGTHDHKAGRNDNSPNWGQRHRAPCCGQTYVVNEV